jgi:ribosomal-protein-serine acetyltransferase
MSLSPAPQSSEPTPLLSDGVVTLRPYRSADALALFAAVRESVEHVSRWLPWCTEDYTVENSAAWIVRAKHHWLTGTAAIFGVFDGENERLLGGVAIDHIDALQRTGNLGYWTRESALGTGVATRAVRLAVRYGLTTRQLARLEIVVASGNRPSQRVADKSGAVFEGILRHRLRHLGQSHDARLYSLVSGHLNRWVW